MPSFVLLKQNTTLPWSLPLLRPFLSFLLDLSPHLVLGPSKDVVGVPEVPTLGGGGLPGAEEAKSPPPPVARPLPSPAIFGLTINQVWSPLDVPNANDALNLAPMPRVFDHFPTSLPLNPLHYDFFTVLRAASPVVTFHCPSPLTQKSFSSVYSISFPRGHDSKPLWLQESNSKCYSYYIF